MNKYSICLLAGLFCIANVCTTERISAQELKPADFAYGISIDTLGQHPVQAFELPQTVYEHLTRDDLGDLRIFNNKDVAVPHALHHAAELPDIEEKTYEVTLFPIYGSSEKTIGELEVQVQQSETGTLVRIKDSPQTPQQNLRGYIIDASHVESTIDGLVFGWNDNPANLMANVSVEHSNDLVHWQTWGQGTLTSMRHNQNVLVKNLLDLPARKATYYRLSWHTTQTFPPLDKLEVRAVPARQEMTRQWASLALEKQSDDIYSAKIPGTIPADRVEIELPEAQTIVRVEVESAASPDGPWTGRFAGLAYNLQAGDDQWQSPPISVYKNTHRYWRLKLSEDASGVMLGTPSLRFGWVPARVLFVPQGDSPYTLAFGNSEAKPAGFKSNELFLPLANDYSDIFDLPTASLGAVSKLGGEARLKTPTDIPWKQVILWGSMIIGVLVLGLLALNLIRQP